MMKKLICGQLYLLSAKSNCVLLKTGKLKRKINRILFVVFFGLGWVFFGHC